jgi:hypothetical protein
MTKPTHMRIWLIVIGLACVLSARCSVATASPEPVKREILALYDGGQEGDADVTRIHRFAELPLNHLGFIVRYHDIRTKLPAPSEIERYRGVLTWFAGSVPDSGSYLAWAAQVSRMNVRYVILGDIGVVASPVNLPAINRILAAAGVRHSGDYIGPTLGSRVVQEDPSLVQFECRLDPVLPDYPIMTANGAGTRIGLMLETPAQEGKRKAALVTIGERGGYAAFNYEFCHQRAPLYQGKWLINPFAFFGAAFVSADQPIPDTTTESGNRLYVSMLDSEGWTRSTKIEGFRDAQAMSGEVVFRELIEPFRDLPATVNLRIGEIPKKGRTGRQARRTLQSLFATPNVEPLRQPMRAMVSRFDSEYPSISNLSPLISAGPDRIVNEPLSDETAYSNGGQVGEDGFTALTESLANTESPRRLKPFNLNYRAYAGEYPARLRSVKDRLREARLAPVTAVSANQYIAIVDGFFRARIDRLGSAAWQISNRGKLQTVRFDYTENREADMQSSVGVIGQKQIGTSLYVALDEAVEPAVIVLGQATHGDTAAEHFALLDSRWMIRHVVREECALSFEAQGYGDGSFAWTAAPGAYLIRVEQGGHELWRQAAEADATGRLEFVLPVGATVPVSVTVSCSTPTADWEH